MRQLARLCPERSLALRGDPRLTGRPRALSRVNADARKRSCRSNSLKDPGPPGLRRPAILASLASIYEEQGVLRERALALTILALTATTAGKATGTASVPAARSTPTPGGENGSIFWPWIGRDYATGGVCLVGLNPPRLEVVVSDARRVRYLLKHARRTREGKTHDRHQQVPAQAAQPQQLHGAAHRRGLRAPPGDVPRRRVRLEQARGRPAPHASVARLRRLARRRRYGGRSLGVPAARSGSGWSANVFADPSESMPGSAARR